MSPFTILSYSSLPSSSSCKNKKQEEWKKREEYDKKRYIFYFCPQISYEDTERTTNESESISIKKFVIVHGFVGDVLAPLGVR
jgi:hypothetical protein